MPRKDPPGLKRLSPEHEVWIDPEKKQVVMTGEVCLREGQLEMFACLKHTKEHESVVAVDTKAFIVHAGLLALGARPGNAVEFVPQYKPASGTQVDVSLSWTDEAGKRHEARAQDWLRNIKTGKAMQHSWVFGGSSFWQDPQTKERHYMAEEGDFICVSNFSSAMLDLPIASPQDNTALLWEAYTDRIPPRGTKVTVYLTPKLEKRRPAKDAAPEVQ